MHKKHQELNAVQTRVFNKELMRPYSKEQRDGNWIKICDKNYARI